MKMILVAFKLTLPETFYSSLTLQLRSYVYWARPADSIWLLGTSESAVQVRDNLMKHLQKEDRLVVFDVSSSAWGTYGIPNEVTEWIKKLPTQFQLK